MSGKACAGELKSISISSSSFVNTARTSRTLFSNCFDETNFLFSASLVNKSQQLSRSDSNSFAVIIIHPCITFFTEFATCHPRTGGTALPICLSVSRKPHLKTKLSGKD